MMTEREWSGVFRNLRTLGVRSVAGNIMSWLSDLEDRESKSLRFEELLNSYGLADYYAYPVSPRLQQYIKVLLRSRMRWFERWCAEHKAAEALREEMVHLQAKIEQQSVELLRVRTDAPGVWAWDGDAQGLEGLTAPVVMSADTLRQLLQAKRDTEERLKEIRAQSASIARQLAGVAR